MDKVGTSRPTAAKTATPTFDRGLEERLAEALRQVASLKLELARVRAAYAALLAAHQAGAAVTEPEPQRSVAKQHGRSDDFDWETWARVTKERIRGEDVEATTA